MNYTGVNKRKRYIQACLQRQSDNRAWCIENEKSIEGLKYHGTSTAQYVYVCRTQRKEVRQYQLVSLISLAFSDNVRTILSARRCSFCSADELTI
jgi:hypothetical protein